MHWSPTSGSSRGWRIPHGGSSDRGTVNIVMADGHTERVVYLGSTTGSQVFSANFEQSPPWTTLIKKRSDMGLATHW